MENKQVLQRWKCLLSTKKLCDDEKEHPSWKDYPIGAFEKDYNKIVSSAAFRRLQDKTQVFPLDKSDFIRTRLTHSIEVSTIARQLGIMISKKKTDYPPKDLPLDISEQIMSVSLCAGLLHDLGNPPFGHFGETVIGQWFQDHLDKITYKDRTLKECLSANPQMIKDLEHFEGNAQALRILLKARYRSEMNISFAVISSLVKYPTTSLKVEGKKENKEEDDVRRHKPGIFLSEYEEFKKISGTLGTINSDGSIGRHPLAYVVEAADDIAYATDDIEDAYKKKLFTLDELIQYLQEKVKEQEKIKEKKEKTVVDPNKQKDDPLKYPRELVDNLAQRKETSKNDSAALREWLNYTRRWLMHVAVYGFSYNYEAIMAGTYSHDLFFHTFHSPTIDWLKGVMNRFVFDTSDILRLELSAQTILHFLLDKFVHAALYYDCNDVVMTKADTKLMSIFSENYKQDYQKAKAGDETYDLYLRLLMVTDFISGMTDSYARTLYRELSGIE